jgi:hypothetical protein
MPVTNQDKAARLLLRALDSLKPNERDTVLEALLTGSIGRSSSRPAPHRPRMMTDLPTLAPHMRQQQMEQPLLIRCSAELHSRLRKWSAANGFSMAAVARGVIELFLDEQEGKDASGRRPRAKR